MNEEPDSEDKKSQNNPQSPGFGENPGGKNSKIFKNPKSPGIKEIKNPQARDSGFYLEIF